MESSIKDRIQKIMDAEQLSPAKFADALGVQRSLISHIMNERNKPGTDIISKILKTFPKVSADWLFIGSGNMYHTEKPLGSLSLFDETPPVKTIEPITSPVLKEEQTTIPPVQHEKVDVQIQTVLKDKKVEKIIIYYSDSTFEEYFSSKR